MHDIEPDPRGGNARLSTATVRGLSKAKTGSLVGLPWRIALKCVDDLGLVLRAEIVVHKLNHMPDNRARGRALRSHEVVFHFSNRRDHYFSDERLRPSVWSLGSEPFVNGNGHPAPMNREVVRRCVLGWSRPGDVVLDPFVGSGTVPMVASALRRVGVGVDLSNDYLAVARDRMASTEGTRVLKRTKVEAWTRDVDDPAVGVAAAAWGLEHAEVELRRAVGEARAAGLGWRDIGAVLGTSKQAAHQRFGTGDVLDASPGVGPRT